MSQHGRVSPVAAHVPVQRVQLALGRLLLRLVGIEALLGRVPFPLSGSDDRRHGRNGLILDRYTRRLPAVSGGPGENRMSLLGLAARLNRNRGPGGRSRWAGGNRSRTAMMRCG